MKIRSLTVFQIPVVLRKPVRHASHERSDNETFLVRCELSDGAVGWGEGLPRTYVTGDSTASSWRHFEAARFSELRDAPWNSPDEAFRVIHSWHLSEVLPDPGISVRECFGNPVRCAVELSILDAVCRSASVSVSDVISRMPEFGTVTEQSEVVYYSGAVTSMSPRKQLLSALKMRLFGFRQVKVKVGTEGVDDQGIMRRVRRIVGPRVDLRIDANEAWKPEEVADRMRPLLRYQPTSLEQPVAHSEVAQLSEVRHHLGVPVMLDESLCCLEDGERAIQSQWCDLFNIRLSKCGGLYRSAQLAVLAKAHGLGYQLGCQVGETGILSAAGRQFACSIGGIRYLEGSFDRFLVREALTKEDLTFRYGGRAPRLKGPGLGMTVNESTIRKIQVREMPLIRP
ncbi:MAG: hypothetical protein JNL58_07435 [Planctomyces sp.]|nr:hypothetical protein [Planctomyces sp.]